MGRSTKFRRTLTPMLLVLAAMLSACNATSAAAPDRTETLARAAQLAAGTMSVEGTPQAVDASQAVKLLPLWELMSDLSTSSSAASPELAATVDAIEAAMESEQLAVIDATEVVETGIAGSDAPSARSAGASAQTQDIAAAGMDPALMEEAGRAMAALPMEAGAPPGGGGVVGAGASSASPTMPARSTAYQSIITLLTTRARES